MNQIFSLEFLLVTFKKQIDDKFDLIDHVVNLSSEIMYEKILYVKKTASNYSLFLFSYEIYL